MDILDDMGVSKLSAKVCFFFKLNYALNQRLLGRYKNKPPQVTLAWAVNKNVISSSQPMISSYSGHPGIRPGSFTMPKEWASSWETLAWCTVARTGQS